jgi:hypothetical protein
MSGKTNAIAKVGYDIVSFSDADARSLSDDALLIPTEVAAILRCSISILNKWRCDGRGPRYVRAGGFIRYRAGDIRAFIAENVRTSTSSEAPPSAA